MLIEVKTSIRFGIIEESELKREERLKKAMVKFASLFRMIKAHSLGLFCLILLRQVHMWGKGHSCHMGADIVERCSGYPTHFPLSFVEMSVFNSRGLLVLDWIPRCSGMVLWKMAVLHVLPLFLPSLVRHQTLPCNSTFLSSIQVQALVQNDIRLNMRSLTYKEGLGLQCMLQL